MIHIIATIADAGMAANVGGVVDVSSQIIAKIDNPALEEMLRRISTPHTYLACSLSYLLEPVGTPEEKL